MISPLQHVVAEHAPIQHTLTVDDIYLMISPLQHVVAEHAPIQHTLTVEAPDSEDAVS
jgi:hypothetical protein